MPNYKNFANGGMEDMKSSEFSSIRHRQVRDTKVGSRIERVWATDFQRCVSREDFEKYISKYSKYDLNKYVRLAKAKIESLDAAENARVEREKAAQRVQQRSIAPRPGGNDIPSKNKIIQNLMQVAVWIVILGGVGLYSYNKYQQEKQEKNGYPTNVVMVPQTTLPQDSEEERTSRTQVNETYEPDNSVTETEPQEVWWDCPVCGTTGSCQLCFGSSRCGVCGGTGSLYRSYSCSVDELQKFI